jgi:hypothetical protein
MSVFDVKQMAKDLVFLNDQHISAKEVVAERLIEAAVEVVNFPKSRHLELFEGLAEVYELEMGLPCADGIVMELVERIKRDMAASGWDPRMKVKLESKKLSNTFHRITVRMDLDATVQAEVSAVRRTHTKARRPEITDVVSDNPGAELLNEFDRELSRQLKPRTPLLSDRGGRFINSDKNGRKW